MNGPLSGKQQREQLKFIAKEQRENAKLEADESRKDQLHELKLQTELAKSKQGLVHKEKDHAEKTGKRPSSVPPIQGFSDGTTEVEPLSRMGKPLSGRPHVGGRMLGKVKPLGGKPLGGSTDTVPTMLTPGEAVIPVEAAQDPKNKAVIAGLVNEGRAKKKRRGKADKNYLGFEDGTTSVPKPKGVSGELMRRIKEWDWSQAPRPKQEVVVVPQTVPYVGTFNGQPVTRNPVAVVPQMESSVGKNIKDTANYGNEVMVPVKGYEDGGWVDAPESVQEQPGIDIPQPEAQFVSGAPVVPVMERRVGMPAPVIQPIAIPQIDDRGAAQRMVESGGRHTNPDGSLVTSPKGAQGIAQIMPNTGVSPGYGVMPLRDNSEQEAIRFQNDYMNAMRKLYGGDERKALAAYNAGPGRVDKALTTAMAKGGEWDSYLPDETKKYINKLAPQTVAPTGRDILIAQQDLATSTNPKVRAKAQALLDSVGSKPTTIASAYQGTMPAYGNPDAVARMENPPKVINPVTNAVQPSAPVVPPQSGSTPTVIPPIEVPEDTVGAVKLDNLGIVSKSLAPQLGTIVAEAAADPEKGESWLASAIGSVFGDKGLFNKQELTRFATVAAGSLLFGGRMVNGRYQPASLPGSLKYAGLDALQQSDKRHVRDEMFDEKKQAAEGARIAEGAKNSRELYEQREKDYHSTIALEDIPIETKNDVMKWIRTQPMENAQQRASVYGRATEMLGANRSKVDKVNNGVESQKQQWLVTPNGRQLVQAYTDKNQKATFYEDPKTKAWINVNTIPNARVETHADYTSNKKMVEDSISKKIGPWVDKLSTRENGGKHSPGKADNLRNNLTSHIADIVYEMPNLDDKAIGQIVDSTVKQIDAEGNKPENLDGAGIRRAVLGNAVMHLNNSNLSLYDAAMSSDKKFVNPSITALTKYGAKVEGLSKNYGKSIGEISSGLEKEWMSEKNTATRKQYMNGGKAREKGVSPMMQWVFDIN